MTKRFILSDEECEKCGFSCQLCACCVDCDQYPCRCDIDIRMDRAIRFLG